MKEVKATSTHEVPKSAHSTLYVSLGNNSACSSERTMNGDHVSLRGKTVKYVQGCLPSLVSWRGRESFLFHCNERPPHLPPSSSTIYLINVASNSTTNPNFHHNVSNSSSLSLPRTLISKSTFRFKFSLLNFFSINVITHFFLLKNFLLQ